MKPSKMNERMPASPPSPRFSRRSRCKTFATATDDLLNPIKLFLFVSLLFLVQPVLASGAPDSDASSNESTRPTIQRVPRLLQAESINKEWPLFKMNRIIRSSPDARVYQRAVAPGETVLIGVQRRTRNTSLDPVAAWHVPEEMNHDVRIEFSIVPPPFYDPEQQTGPNTVRFHAFYVTRGNQYTLPQGKQWEWTPYDVLDESLTFPTPRLTHVPLKVPNTELYVAPFAKRNDQTYSLLVAITNDRKRLKPLLNIQNDPDFNWTNVFTAIEQRVVDPKSATEPDQNQ